VTAFGRFVAPIFYGSTIAAASIGCGRLQALAPLEIDQDSGSMDTRSLPVPEPDAGWHEVSKLGLEDSADHPNESGDGDAAMSDVAIEDVGPTDSGLLGYDEAAKRILDARNSRWVECFHAARELLEQPQYDIYSGKIDPIRYQRSSVDAGRIAVDPIRMQSCIDRYRSASCQELATSFQEDSTDFCPKLLVGTVAAGERCTQSADCADSEHLVCRVNITTDVCSRVAVCGPKPIVGDVCDFTAGACSEGQFCDPATKLCARMSGVGEPCHDYSAPCEDGLGCSLQGICQIVSPPPPLKKVPLAGIPCITPGGCELPYVCVRDAPTATGTCGVGRKLGESCNNENDSSCAYNLRCVVSASGSVCGFGTAVGDMCFYGGEAVKPCTLGSYCSRDWKCTAQKPEGAPCNDFHECQVPLICGWTTLPGDGGFCTPSRRQVVAVGQSCWALSVDQCVEHADCNGLLSAPGICTTAQDPCAADH
jgi:hypothetical protein